MTAVGTVQSDRRQGAFEAGTIELHGHGLVGRAFASRAAAEGLPARAIHSRSGRIAGPPGPCAILVDATGPAYAGPAAEAWVAFLEGRLRAGTSVVTCNKAPLALAWDRLAKAAELGGSTIACSATVGGGTPVLAWARRLRRSHGFAALEASLSGTLSFVLARVAAGTDLDAAVADAQRLGYAEPDPGLDLDGTDARAKAVLLHNAAFGGALRLRDAGPRLQLDARAIRAAAGAGLRPTVVARIQPGSVSLRLVGRPWQHPPGTIAVHGALADGSHTELAGPGAGAAATAGALVADLREVLAGRAAPGVWP